MNAKQYRTLAELDWASAGLANVFNLFNLKLAWKYPLLVLLAVIFWFVSTYRTCRKNLADKSFAEYRGVPIATIFPPATLSL